MVIIIEIDTIVSIVIVKGLVLHDRVGERPEELDLKSGQYVFLTSRVQHHFNDSSSSSSPKLTS